MEMIGQNGESWPVQEQSAHNCTEKPCFVSLRGDT